MPGLTRQEAAGILLFLSSPPCQDVKRTLTHMTFSCGSWGCKLGSLCFPREHLTSHLPAQQCLLSDQIPSIHFQFYREVRFSSACHTSLLTPSKVSLIITCSWHRVHLVKASTAFPGDPVLISTRLHLFHRGDPTVLRHSSSASAWVSP